MRLHSALFVGVLFAAISLSSCSSDDPGGAPPGGVGAKCASGEDCTEGAYCLLLDGNEAGSCEEIPASCAMPVECAACEALKAPCGTRKSKVCLSSSGSAVVHCE